MYKISDKQHFFQKNKIFLSRRVYFSYKIILASIQTSFSEAIIVFFNTFLL